MSLIKRITGAIDPSTIKLTKLLQKQRGIQIGPSGTAQGLFYSLGVDSIGNTMSPEATLARMLKEWTKVRGMSIDMQTSLIEWRVFSKNFWHGYPEFDSIDDWFMWRLSHEFPNHAFSQGNGWTLEFLSWAKERAREMF